MASLPLTIPPGLVRAIRIGPARKFQPAPACWSLQEVAGRLTEISGLGDGASLTLAFSLLLDAQQQGETVAWITRTESSFFPLDAWANGIDLEALAVARMPDERAIVRAADRLARSGGFGLVVLDLGSASDKATALGRAPAARVSTAMQARLRSLAQHHDMAILCLTRKAESSSSLGSMVSLHAESARQRSEAGGFQINLRVLKDKLRGPGWTMTAERRGPDGLQ